MYQLQMYSGKDEPKDFYWITEKEYFGIKELLEAGAKFITLSRLGKTINSKDIKELGVPNFILPMIQKGYKIVFFNDIPTIVEKGFIMEYQDRKWERYEGMKSTRNYKTYEEFIGEGLFKLI